MIKDKYGGRILSCCFPSPPDKDYKVIWEITNKCNLQCGHCIARANENNGSYELSREELLAVSQILGENKVSTVLLTGGEPLLRPELFDIIKSLNDKNITTKLATNGLLLSKDNIKKLKSVGQDRIIVSLDGASPQIHDSFRGIKGLFEKVARAIDYAINLNVKVTVTYTASKQNISELSKLISFCEGKRAKHLIVNAVQPIGRAKDEFYKYSLQAHNFEYITYCARNSSFEVIPIRCGGGIKKPLSSCPAGVNVIGISSNGFINPCPWLKDTDSDFCYGRIFDYSHFSELKDHPLTRKLKNIEIMRKTQYCNSCTLEDKCGGGCPATAIAHNSLLDPLCYAHQSAPKK